MSACQFPKCSDDATVRVHYEDLHDSVIEKPRELCKGHYNKTDESGLKYYQIGTKKVEVL
mgnify:CR=1|jgi:hypothetical protein